MLLRSKASFELCSLFQMRNSGFVPASFKPNFAWLGPGTHCLVLQGNLPLHPCFAHPAVQSCSPFISELFWDISPRWQFQSQLLPVLAWTWSMAVGLVERTQGGCFSGLNGRLSSTLCSSQSPCQATFCCASVAFQSIQSSAILQKLWAQI